MSGPIHDGSRDTAMPAAPKLRDSCNACATSKVKCDRSKPVCGRCSTRETTCEYLAAKRSGRSGRTRRRGEVPQPRVGTDETVEADMTPAAYGVASSGLTRPPSGLRTPASSISANFPPGLLTQANPPPSSLAGASTHEFDSFLTPLSSVSLLDAGTMGVRPHQLHASLDNFGDGSHLGLNNAPAYGPFTSPADADSNTFGSFNPSYLPTLSPCTTNTSNSRQSSHRDLQELVTDSTCSCLLRAISLLQQLCADMPLNNKQSNDDAATRLAAVRSLVVDHAPKVEAVVAMLRCHCSRDGYLLSIISLTAFKILGIYQTAARGLQNPTKEGARGDSMSLLDDCQQYPNYMDGFGPPMTPVTNNAIELEQHAANQTRQAAQLILSELHHVQSLVNLLSKRIQSPETLIGQPHMSTANAKEHDPVSSPQESPAFSWKMLGQMEADLRGRLRSMSTQVLDVLRLD